MMITPGRLYFIFFAADMQDEYWVRLGFAKKLLKLLLNWKGYVWPIAQEHSENMGSQLWWCKALAFFFIFPWNSINDIQCLHQVKKTFKYNLCTLQNVKATSLLLQFLRSENSPPRQKGKQVQPHDWDLSKATHKPVSSTLS